MKSKTFFLIKTKTGLMPADDESREALKLVGIGDAIKCTTSGMRNYRFLRKFMKLIKLGYENQDQFTDITTFRYWLMIKAGHYTITPDGTPVPHSVAFDKMDEVKFSEVYDEVHRFLCQWLEVDEQEMNRLIDFI
jgi:hypothetical protein